jgi:hypothetical protein
MDRPRNISSGEAMRWNADVEHRRREYHERRCAEDPIYKRAYERRQEMLARIQKMNSMAMAQISNAIYGLENTKLRAAVENMAQCVKSHDEIMRERKNLLTRMKQEKESGIANGLTIASISVWPTLFCLPETEWRLKEMEEEQPYVEEIRKADNEFDSELISLSGFDW